MMKIQHIKFCEMMLKQYLKEKRTGFKCSYQKRIKAYLQRYGWTQRLSYSKSEREKQISYNIAYMWNLGK